jgi:hypothetical protein
MLDRMHQMWDECRHQVTRIGFADAMSWTMPHQVERQLAAIKERWPAITDFNLHLHDGRGMALASVYAALRVLDGTDTLRLQTSIGGMAGCPYCGNGRAAVMIATEDLMHMLEEMGIHTGVDLYKLVEVVWLAEEIVGHPLYGRVSKAGPLPRYDRLYPMDMPRIETLEQAKHFIKGPAAYAGAPSPWKAPIRSFMRPESLEDQASETPPTAPPEQCARDPLTANDKKSGARPSRYAETRNGQAARRTAYPRSRQPDRGAVLRHAARRHGRRRDQGRAPRGGRHDPRHAALRQRLQRQLLRAQPQQAFASSST